MHRKRITATALAALAILLIAGYAAAHVLSGDAEVRISARRLDDGRTEFALQQRADGEWGERNIPRFGVLPAEVRTGVWLNSSPLIVDTEPTPSDVSVSEQMDSAIAGLVEARRALADANSLDSVDVDDLLRDLEATETAVVEASQALEATTEDLHAAKNELAEANAALERFTTPIVRELGEIKYDNNRISTEVEVVRQVYGVDEIATVIKVTEDGDHKYGDVPLQLFVRCYDGDARYWLGSVPLTPAASKWGSKEYELTYTLNGDLGEHGDIGSGTISTFAAEASDYSFLKVRSGWVTELPHHVAVALRSATSLEVTLTGADDETPTATFSMDGVWQTPVQPNIDRCGDYY